MAAPSNGRYEERGEEGPDLGRYMDQVADDAKQWYEAQRDLTTLVAAERLGKLSGTVLMAVVGAFAVISVLVMASVALAIALGRYFNDFALGFLAVSGIFLLLAIAFYLLWRHVLRDRITLGLINAAYGKD